MSRNYRSLAEPKTLTGDVTNVATQITISNVTGLPSPPYVLVLSPDTASEEAVLVTVDQTGVTSPTLKVQRAIEAGATAQPHTNLNEVRHMIVGSDLQLVHDHLDDTTTAHGATGAVVGTTNTQTLTNKTLTAPKINENVSITATSTEINVLDGILASTAELNILNDATVTTAELNILDGVTATTAEINHVDGVTSAIQTQLNTNTPIGTILMYGGATAPTGWLLCDGSTIPTEHTTLRNLVGTTTPDLMGRVPVGYGNGSGLTNRLTMFDKSGVENVTLTAAQSGVPAHSHSITDQAHVHYQSGRQVAAASGGAPALIDPSDGIGSTQTGGAYTGITTTNNNTAVNASTSHPNMQPFTVVNFIIKF